MRLKPYHIFYIGFFVVYFLVIYFLLYHINGLNSFSVNIHYFANISGSLLKRFLSDAAPIALIFYLLYYTKRIWKRIVLIILFIVTLFLNALAIGWYLIARTNFQLYHLESFDWNLLISYITLPSIIFLIFLIPIILGMSFVLFKIQYKTKKLRLFKFRQKGGLSISFTALLLILTIGSPFIPIKYSTHPSLFETESLKRDFYRTVELEHSGISRLIKEIKFRYFPPKPISYQLNEEEKALIQENNLDTQITTSFPNPPKKILLVILESLDQKFLSYYNPELPIKTTYVDQLFQKYPHVDEFYASGVYTPFALSALFCGHANFVQTTENPSYACFPKLLVEAGYRTELIKGDTKYFVGSLDVHFKKFGIEFSFSQEEFEEKFPDYKKTHYDLFKVWGYTDNYVFNEAVERLKNSRPEDKLFLMLEMADVHFPGGRCAYEKTEDDPEDPLLFSIKCFDHVLKEFMDNLKKENLLTEDLVILITADQLYPGYNDIQGEEYQTSVTSRQAKIPLLMITEADIDFIANQGSQLDVSSTILDFANVDIPSYYMGKSLISNPHTTPMGQDRKNGYMIIGNEFYLFSIDPQIKLITNLITKEN